MKKLFKDWNYKKHAKVVTCMYAVMYIIDMTAGYFLIRKSLKTGDEKKKLDK